MPELPEVETIRRHLASHVEGRRLTEVEIRDARWCRPLTTAEATAALAGRRVERLERRGKYLVFSFDDDSALLCHLRMTGTVLYDAPDATPYVRVRLALDDGHELRFSDPRRFGTGELTRTPAERDAFFAARLGVEPLSDELTTAYLRVRARNRRAPVKAFLLDQRHVAGVGNIYADEALFRSGIHPLRPAGRLTTRQLDALRAAVVQVLEHGIDAGGATIDDFRHPTGAEGSFQNDFLVHRRVGDPCPRCGGPVTKIVAAGRGTYVCRSCQPPPRRAGTQRAATPRSRAAAPAARRARRPAAR